MPLYDDTDDSTKTNHSRNTFAPMPVSMPRRPQPVHQIQQPFQNYIPPIQPQNHIPQPQQQPIAPQFQQQPIVPQPQQLAQPQQQQQPPPLVQQSPRAHSTPRHQISPANAHHSRTPVKNPNKSRERESREIPRRSSRPVKPRTLNYNINTTISTQSRSPSHDRSSTIHKDPGHIHNHLEAHHHDHHHHIDHPTKAHQIDSLKTLHLVEIITQPLQNHQDNTTKMTLPLAQNFFIPL
jgi:hypothetical protein